jgi:hypothetical protein
VPAGFFTVELGSAGAAPTAAIAVLVALAMAWIAGERRPASAVVPERLRRRGRTDRLAAFVELDEAGCVGERNRRTAHFGDQAAADGTGEQRGGSRK